MNEPEQSSAPINEHARQLFEYYSSQSRHTEDLWVKLNSFYSALLTGVVAAVTYLSTVDNWITSVRALSAIGLVFSLFAVCAVYSYQVLIGEWVEKKNAIEEYMYDRTEVKLQAIGTDAILAKRGRKVLILPAAVGVYVTFAIGFAAVLVIAIFNPDLIEQVVRARTSS